MVPSYRALLCITSFWYHILSHHLCSLLGNLKLPKTISGSAFYSALSPKGLSFSYPRTLFSLEYLDIRGLWAMEWYPSVYRIEWQKTNNSWLCNHRTSSDWPYPVSYKKLSCFSETTHQNCKSCIRGKMLQIIPGTKVHFTPPQDQRTGTWPEPESTPAFRIHCPERSSADPLNHAPNPRSGRLNHALSPVSLLVTS